MYMINTMTICAVPINAVPINAMPMAAPKTRSESRFTLRTAPLAATCTGSKSAFGSQGTPAFGHVVIDVRAFDAKQAAPPRGRFR
jgi:hypothetical protein